jgi:hypothetical protein
MIYVYMCINMYSIIWKGTFSYWYIQCAPKKSPATQKKDNFSVAFYTALQNLFKLISETNYLPLCAVLIYGKEFVKFLYKYVFHILC